MNNKLARTVEIKFLYVTALVTYYVLARECRSILLKLYKGSTGHYYMRDLFHAKELS